MVRILTVFLSLISVPASVLAADDSTMTLNMDTVWVATAAALVFFMQAGFALLESGMARAKNTVNVIMKNYVDACVGSLMFWMLGFGIMFGVNHTGWFGEDHFFVDVAGHFDYSFLLFQTMFAATAVTIASGAMAERTHYRGYLIGAIIVTSLIYPIFGSWAWGGFYGGQGWLAELGFIDFAGSTVVHSVGGWVALAGIIVLGPRMGRFTQDGRAHPIPGHNLTSVALGGFILWLGWFGFNGGSTVAATANIGLININTHLAASAGAVGSMLALLALRSPIYMTTVINGSIAGLVGITAGCATMTPPFAALTGLVAGVIMVVGERVMFLLRLDDVVGAVPVHAFAGAWGTLAAGMFKTGDLFNLEQVIVQVVGISAAFLWVFPLSLLMYYLLDKTVGLRADSIAEQRGLDFSEHYEIGYPEFQMEKLHAKRS